MLPYTIMLLSTLSRLVGMSFSNSPGSDSKTTFVAMLNIWKPVRCVTPMRFHLLYVGMACWQSARLVIKRLRVRIPAEAKGKLPSPESTLCADSYSVSVPPPVLPQWHVKDPGHSAKSGGGRLHFNSHTPSTQRSRSRLTMPLCRHSVGTYQETSSHAHSVTVVSARWDTVDRFWLKEWNWCARTNPRFKKKIKSSGGDEWSNFFPKSSQARKKPPTWQSLLTRVVDQHTKGASLLKTGLVKQKISSQKP